MLIAAGRDAGHVHVELSQVLLKLQSLLLLNRNARPAAGATTCDVYVAGPELRHLSRVFRHDRVFDLIGETRRLVIVIGVAFEGKRRRPHVI